MPLFGICDKFNHFCIKFMSQSCQSYYWISANIVTIKIWPCLQRYTIHMMLILFKIFGGWGIAGRKVKSDRKVLRSAEAETHLGGDGGGIDGIIGKKQLFLLLLVNRVALNRQKVYTSCNVKGDSCFNDRQVCSDKL